MSSGQCLRTHGVKLLQYTDVVRKPRIMIIFFILVKERCTYFFFFHLGDLQFVFLSAVIVDAVKEVHMFLKRYNIHFDKYILSSHCARHYTSPQESSPEEKETKQIILEHY